MSSPDHRPHCAAPRLNFFKDVLVCELSFSTSPSSDHQERKASTNAAMRAMTRTFQPVLIRKLAMKRQVTQQFHRSVHKGGVSDL